MHQLWERNITTLQEQEPWTAPVTSLVQWPTKQNYFDTHPDTAARLKTRP